MPRIDVVCTCPLDSNETREAFRVTGVSDPAPIMCFYCASCAELAQLNWHGETASAEPVPASEIGPASRAVEFDPLGELVDALPLQMPGHKRGALLATIADAIGTKPGSVRARLAVREIDGVEEARVHVTLDGIEIAAVPLDDLDAEIAIV